MPELPDVEGFRRALAERLPGRRIRHVHVCDAGILRNASARSFARRLVGRRFAQPRRHGKWLILPTDGPVILVHSGMTGHPHYAPSTEAREDHERLVLTLDRGEFRYADQRKLRGVWIAADDQVSAVTGPLGPDALTVDRATFADILGARRGKLKPALMDQALLAGLGNLLSDEICWQARVNPLCPIADLEPADVGHLYSRMRQVLRTSVRHGRVPGLRRWLTGVRDAMDPACPRCGTPLQRGRNQGRGTLWCPRCQAP
ncbi:MAG TPA: DNA-formamidopyrimidine glycosylase family protein [Acidimicrobiales bacterium]|nr:DNA-formamidopyrimidine glycosylase family protein [Acidimicrobiales bacterium]HWF21134.1 DNA-formamidopyrimidine glycosylase family protein [Acidimicrobiales bacterium]